ACRCHKHSFQGPCWRAVPPASRQHGGGSRAGTAGRPRGGAGVGGGGRGRGPPGRRPRAAGGGGGPGRRGGGARYRETARGAGCAPSLVAEWCYTASSRQVPRRARHPRCHRRDTNAPPPLPSARMRFSVCRRYAPARSIEGMRVLVVEDEPYMAEAIRDWLRLEAIAADIAGDGDTALELLSVNAYDIAVLDRDIPGPSGDEVAESI